MNKKYLIFLLILFVLCAVAMGIMDSFIKNEVTQNGIVSFQFIASISRVNQAIHLWGDNGNAAVGFSLGLDYLFILVYSALSIYLLISTSNKLSGVNLMMSKLTYGLACIFPVAGLCDAAENYGLLRLLFGSQNQLWVDIAYYCASIKFLIIGVSLICLLIGSLLIFVKHR